MVGLFTDPAEILEPGNRCHSNLGGIIDIRDIRAKIYYTVLSRKKEQYCINLLLRNLFGR